MFKLGIVTDEIALDVREAVRLSLKHGINKFELRCLGSYEKRIPFVEKADLEFLDQKLKAGEIEITALSPGVFKINASETEKLAFQFEKTLPETFAMAKRFGAKKVIVFGFMRDSTPEAKIVELLKKTGEMAAKHDIMIAVENEPGAYCDTGANTARIINAVNMKNVKVNWDAGNAVMSGDIAYPTGYNHVKEHIVNVHIKDAVAYPKIENRLVNDGGVNWLGQLSALERDKIVPFYTLETHFLPLYEATVEDLRRLKIIYDAVQKLEKK